MRTRPVGVALALALIATPTLAGENAHEPLAFVAVPAPRPSVVSAAPSVQLLRPSMFPLWPVGHGPRPAVTLPSNPPRLVAVGTNPCCPREYSGVASWYCGHGSRCTVGYPGGLYAAIRRDLLGHRGHQARVCSPPRCVVVTVIDCLCAGGPGIIDLYSDAFIRLAPLSRGRIQVTLTWIR